MGLGKLIVRLVVGGIFIGHGLQKLRGSFGGPGLEGTEQMMESLEMHPARRNAVAVAVAETAGGAAIAAGAATPLAAGGLIATMTTAIRKVHAEKGLWNTEGGYEYNLVLISVLTGLATDGPGNLSIDGLAGKPRWGIWGGIFALAAGLAGSTAVTTLGRKNAEIADPGEQTASAESGR
jgi:putative oxidoreductase